MLLREGAWTLLDLHFLYSSPTVTSSSLSLIVLASSVSQTTLIFSLLAAVVLYITNPSCLCLTLPFLMYAVEQHANNALRYFKRGYKKIIKKFINLSVFRFAVFFEARLLNTTKCNDAWIEVT